MFIAKYGDRVAGYFEVSAKDNTNVKEAFDLVLRLAVAAQRRWLLSSGVKLAFLRPSPANSQVRVSPAQTKQTCQLQ